MEYRDYDVQFDLGEDLVHIYDVLSPDGQETTDVINVVAEGGRRYYIWAPWGTSRWDSLAFIPNCVIPTTRNIVWWARMLHFAIWKKWPWSITPGSEIFIEVQLNADGSITITYSVPATQEVIVRNVSAAELESYDATINGTVVSVSEEPHGGGAPKPPRPPREI